MQIMQKNNINSMTPKNVQSKPHFTTEKYNQIYDEEFVSLINSLNESIKEYFKVSKNNISEANTILISYDQQAESIINLMNLIVSTSSYDRLNELFEQIPKVLEVIKQMKINTNSNNNNLTLFFDDAKILFKSMRIKRKEKLNEINNNNTDNLFIKTSSDSYTNSYNQENKFIKNMNNQINNPNTPNSNLNINNSILNTIKIIYPRIMKLLNGFSDFNYMLSKINFEESNKFNNLQNSVKKEFENFFNFLNKNLGNNNNNLLTQNKSCKNINENKLNPIKNNIQNKYNNQEFEKLKQINEMSKKKIMELNNLLNAYKKKIRELEIKNNNLIIKLQNSEQTIMNLENNMKNNNLINSNTDFNNALNQKDFQILNLQKQLKVYQKNENRVNIQINNLNKQFNEKLGQYEYKISQMSENITNQNNFISNLQNELNMKNNEIENMKLLMKDQRDYDINKNLEILNMEIKEKESKIKSLNEELINYQRKEKINQKQIEDMNNNIFNYEKIIKQKDELINSNYKDNNDVLKIKLENEKLKKQIEELKNINKNNYLSQNQKNRNVNMNSAEIQELKVINNNYLLQNQRMINGNINSYERPEMHNQEYVSKINELNQEIQNLKQNLFSLNESKVKLELEIDKKNDELEGFKQVIFKLQNKLERNNDEEEERKNRVNTERSENNKKNYQSEVNLKDTNTTSKNLNKSFEMPKDSNTQLMNKFLSQLNDAEKKISLLQNKNRELQFKLDEKQVEKDFSGYRTEDYNFSNYEEEFDLKKMVNGAREKNRSEDINIDYPGVQSVKDKYKELLQNMHLLEEQIKILISNISCNNKIKPQITQICQLMRIPAKNIQAIIAGKDKKKMLGLII